MSTLKIYNSHSREKETFVPLNPPYVGLYVCGPTLYNEVHLGNLRTFVSFDVVYRYLKTLGYKVRYVRNITDVGHLENDADEGEDKIAKQAKLENLEPMEVVQKYTVSFREILQQFNCISPSIEPLATGHIPEQIEMVQRILENGYAYVVDGSVYFDVRKYSEKFPYGELSGRKIDELLNTTRDLDGQEEKRDPLDFALWKKASPEHIMKWNSPWGLGFPGWHIECSAMSKKYLGEKFDIHGGGMDLKFPHHECEIAQSAGDCGHAPVRYWMHGNMLTFEGVKMSKSKGNSILPKELLTGSHPLLEKGFSSMVIRFFMLQSHYSSELDFSNEALKAAEKGFQRLCESIEKIALLKVSEQSTIETEITQCINLCAANMNDDFNTPKTIAQLFELSSIINKAYDGLVSVSAKDIEDLKHVFTTYFEEALGLKTEKIGDQSKTVDGLMNLILELRKDARDRKDWTASDKVRDALKALNIQVKDGKEGTTWGVQ